MLPPAQIDTVLQAIAHPTRRALYERIAKTDEITVRDLTDASTVTQGAISQHLKLLKQAGLVIERPQGRNVFYRAQPDGLAPVADWLSHYEAFWRDSFDKLRSLLKEIDQ